MTSADTARVVNCIQAMTWFGSRVLDLILHTSSLDFTGFSSDAPTVRQPSPNLAALSLLPKAQMRAWRATCWRRTPPICQIWTLRLHQKCQSWRVPEGESCRTLAREKSSLMQLLLFCPKACHPLRRSPAAC